MLQAEGELINSTMDLMFANILERQIDYFKVDKDFKRVVKEENQDDEQIDYDQAYILIK